eukprot:jgi/Galph1/116/GphlegSOOS_G4796.1
MSTWKERLRAGLDKVGESTKLLSDELKAKLEETSGRGDTVQVSSQLVERLQRALHEKEQQCEALFQAKQSMEESIRQIITDDNEANVFLKLQTNLEEERQHSKQCLEENNRLTSILEKKNQEEEQLRQTLHNLQVETSQWKLKATEESKKNSEKQDLVESLQKELEALKKHWREAEEARQQVEVLEKQMKEMKSKAKDFIYSKLADIRAENASLKEALQSRQQEIETTRNTSSYPSSLASSRSTVIDEIATMSSSSAVDALQDCCKLETSLEAETEDFDSYFQGLLELIWNLCSILDSTTKVPLDEKKDMVETQVEKLKKLLTSMGPNPINNLQERLFQLRSALRRIEEPLKSLSSAVTSSYGSKALSQEVQVQTDIENDSNSSLVSSFKDYASLSLGNQEFIEQLQRELESQKEREEETRKTLEKLQTIDSKRRDKLASLQKEKDEIEQNLEQITSEYNTLKEGYAALEQKLKESEEALFSLQNQLFSERQRVGTSEGLMNIDKEKVGIAKSKKFPSQLSSISELDDNISEPNKLQVVLDELDDVTEAYQSRLERSANILELLEYKLETWQFTKNMASSRVQTDSTYFEADKTQESKDMIMSLENKLQDLQHTLDAVYDEKLLLEKTCTEKERELDKLRENFRNAMQNFADEKETLDKQLEETSNSYQLQIEDMQKESGLLKNRLSELIQERESLQLLLDKKQFAIENLESSLKKEVAALEESRKQISRIREEFIKYKEKARLALHQRDLAIREMDVRLESTKEEHKEALESLSLQVTELKEKLSKAFEERDSLLEFERNQSKEALSALEKKMTDREQEHSEYLKHILASHSERDSEIISLRNKMEEYERELYRLQKYAEQLAEEKQQLEQTIEELSSANTDWKMKHQSLQREISRLRNSSQSSLQSLSISPSTSSRNIAMYNTENFARDTTSLREESEQERHFKLLEQQMDFLKKELRDMNNKYQAAQQLKNDLTFEYLRNVLLRFLETDDVDGLLPVIGQILQFSSTEMEEIRNKRKQIHTQILTGLFGKK